MTYFNFLFIKQLKTNSKKVKRPFAIIVVAPIGF